MSIVSYNALGFSNPGARAFEVQKSLKPYREFLERQIQSINKSIVKAKWKLSSTPSKQKDDELSPASSKQQENELFEISLEPINKKDRLSVFFSEENISQLYAIKPVKYGKKIHWTNDEECEKLRVEDWDERKRVLKLAEKPNSEFTWIAIRPDTYQLQKQLDAVMNLMENPCERHEPLLNLFFESYRSEDYWDSINDDEEAPIDWKLLADESFDGVSEQRMFVKKVLSTPDFAFLEGPPGSGKTRAICEAIRLLIASGKRVLLCASTHVAVDNVLERLMDEKNEWAKQIIPIRIARNESRISSEIVQKYSLQKFVKTEKIRIGNSLSKIENRSESQEEMLNLVRSNNSEADGLMRMILDSANLVCGTSIGILQHPDIKKNSGLTAPFDYLIVDEASKTTFQEFLVPAMWAKRWILVGDVNQLAPYVDDFEIANNLQFLCPDEKMRNMACDLFHATTHNKREQCDILVEAPREEKTRYMDLCKALHAHYVDLDDKKKTIQYNDRNIVYLISPKSFNEKAKGLLANRDNDVLVRRLGGESYLFSDGHHEDPYNWETDLSWRISTSYDLRKSKNSENKARLDSDIKKLIDIMECVQGEKSKIKTQLEILRHVALPSILELLQEGFDGEHEIDNVINCGLPPRTYAERSQSLSFQHRMHPEIAEPSRQYVYEGKSLNSSKNMAEKRKDFWPHTKRMLWVSHMKNASSPEVKSGRNVNYQECELILEKLHDFFDWAKKHPNKAEGSRGIWEVAVLTFYQEQENELWQKLQRKRQEWEEYIRMEICTVDRFQGHEADLVCLSFVKSYPTSFLLSRNRLNVALTRARYQCLLFGHQEALKRALKNRTDEFLYHVTELDYEKIGK